MSRKIFALLVALLFLYIASPLILPVVMGGVLAVLFVPLHERLLRRKLNSGLASALLTFGITLIVLLPTSVLIYQGAKSGLAQLQILKESPESIGGGWEDALVHSPRVAQLINWITQWFPVGVEDLAGTFRDLARTTAARAAEFVGSLLAQLPGIAMTLVVVVVSLYFFLNDGKRVVAFFRRNSMFTAQETETLIQTLGSMCRSVVLASVVSGLAQAVTETVVCVVVGVPNPLLIGILVFMGSFIPVIGSAPVTIFIGLQELLAGRTAVGIVLLVAAGLVMTMDNVIRPWFLRGAGNLHPLLAFVAAFGGLQTLGFIGVFLGPIAAALFLSTVHILMQPGSSQAT